VGFSALAVHLAGGMIEVQFHVFYDDCSSDSLRPRVAPLIAAGVTVALHHLLFWIWLPASMFNYKPGLRIMALHAFFVVLELVPACWIAKQFLGRTFGRAALWTSAFTGPLSTLAPHRYNLAKRVRDSPTGRQAGSL
jgi:uncharacterized RDD family membrane protein YckC